MGICNPGDKFECAACESGGEPRVRVCNEDSVVDCGCPPPDGDNDGGSEDGMDAGDGDTDGG